MENRTAWISTKKSLPPEKKTVDIWVGLFHGPERVPDVLLIDGVFYDEFGEAYDIEETTHWMERPEPPAND